MLYLGLGLVALLFAVLLAWALCRAAARGDALMKRLILVLAFLLLASPVWADPVIYYVDCAANGDAGAGTTTAVDVAWKTIAKVNASSFAAGDSVLFKRGCTWREQLTVPSSGSAGNVITFGAYGTGALPILNGADLITTWTPYLALPNAVKGPMTIETTDLTQWTTTGSGYSGTVTASTTQKKNGSYSMKCTTAADYRGLGYGEQTGVGNLTSWALDGYVYLDATSALTEDATIDIITMKTSGYSVIGQVKLRYHSSAWQVTIDGTNWDALATNQWVRMTIVTAANAYTFYLDSVSLRTGTFANGLGMWSSGFRNGTSAATSALLLYWDDVEVWDGNPLVTASQYQATVTTEPQQVYFNSIIGTKVASIALCNSDKKWYWAANVLYTYGTSDPNGTYPNQIEASSRLYAIKNESQSYVTMQDLDTRLTNDSGVFVYSNAADATNVMIQRCNSQQNAHHGFWANTTLPAGGHNIHYLTITTNTASYNGYTGIYLDSNAPDVIDNVSIDHNTVHHNCFDLTYSEWAGIKIYGEGASTHVVEYNLSYSNKTGVNSGHGYMITLDGGQDTIFRYNIGYDNRHGIWSKANKGTQIYYNVLYSNTDSGIVAANAPIDSNLIYNNVCYGNVTGIQISSFTPTAGGVVNNLIKNNISVGNTGHQLLASNGGENDGTNGSGNLYSYNQFGAPSASHFVSWGGAETDTLVAVNALSGVTANLGADPLFISTVTPDFHLKSTSPCRDAGTNVSLTTDYAGKSVPYGTAPDCGAYEWRKPFMFWFW